MKRYVLSFDLKLWSPGAFLVSGGKRDDTSGPEHLNDLDPADELGRGLIRLIELEDLVKTTICVTVSLRQSLLMNI